MGLRSSETAGKYGSVIKNFLLHPENRTAFLRFFEFCFAHTVEYLRYMQAIGYCLPIDNFSDEKPLQDLAIDILGEFFIKDDTGKYEHIQDYLRRHYTVDILSIDKSILFTQISILLRGFTRKHLGRIKKTTNPQEYMLRRRFFEILKPPEYEDLEADRGRQTSVYRTEFADNLRLNNDLLQGNDLRDLAQQVFHISLTRTKWCRGIFSTLNTWEEYRNALNKQEVINSAVYVNASFIELAFQSSGPPGPDEAILRKNTATAICAAINQIRQLSVARFVQQGRLTEGQAEAVTRAITHMLTDVGEGSELLKLPAYFREELPGIDQSRYLKEYKFVVDTIAAEAREAFRKQLDQWINK